MVNFRFVDGDDVMVWPFRIGDIVKVTDYGASYTSWHEANRYFTGKVINPFYSLKREERRPEILFKVKGVIAHPHYKRVVCYLEDRMKRGILIGAHGVSLVKQFPLRKGESDTIILEKVKETY